MTYPIKAAIAVLIVTSGLIALCATAPVGGLLKLGPECTKACKMSRDDLLEWELQCQRCCDERKQPRSECYGWCSRGRLPVDCKKKIDPDTGCEGR